MDVFLETYGCQMNVYDSELVRAILKNGSFRMTPSIEDADVVLLNTCAIRESAHTRIYGQLGHVRELKRKNPRLIYRKTAGSVRRTRLQVPSPAPLSFL